MSLDDNEVTADEVPGILRRQIEGALNMQRAFFRDYTQCLKDKAIADRACETWEETVERAMGIAMLYGTIVRSAQQYAPDALTEEEREW